MRVPDQFAAKLLDSLRPKEREVLGLCFFDQFDIPDVAHMLRIEANSVSGHLSKGTATVGRVLDADPDEARRLLGLMGDVLARRRPLETFVATHGSTVVEVGVLPHRQLMGVAVRDDHQASDVTRYFITRWNGETVGAAQAGERVLDAPLMIGLRVRQAVLASKGIKSAAKFDRESSCYFLPAGFGSAELYFERDFDHAPTRLPLPPGRTIIDRMPPPPLEVARRVELVPQLWPLRVMDLGDYTRECSDAMSADAEEGLRDSGSRERR